MSMSVSSANSVQEWFIIDGKGDFVSASSKEEVNDMALKSLDENTCSAAVRSSCSKAITKDASEIVEIAIKENTLTLRKILNVVSGFFRLIANFFSDLAIKIGSFIFNSSEKNEEIEMTNFAKSPNGTEL
jgi:hypothetical protein